MSDSIAVLIPVFNDWAALQDLLLQLDAVLSQEHERVSVVLIDDASSEVADLTSVIPRLTAIERVKLVSLRRNLGHQRAIAIGLTLVHDRHPQDIVVVMDGDGQDRAEDVPRLLNEVRQRGRTSIVFAERVRRSEGIVFAVCYHVYRVAHLLLTGERVRFGNFSAVPRACLERLVAVSELWAHYAAAIIRSRIPYVSIRTRRADRLAGRPTMKFTGLVMHGLSALAVFSDVIGVRLMLTSSVAAAVILAATLVGGFELLGISLLLLLVAFGTMLVFTFMILASRQASQFIPLRDYGYFVLKDVDL